jgi:hypothetical protein
MVGKKLVAVSMNKPPIPDFTEENTSESGDKPHKKCYNFDAVLSVDEYRKILNDNASSSEQIKKRILYLEAFCRNIIRLELEKNAD